MARHFVIVISLALAGCVSPQPFVAGGVVSAPSGWADFCERHQQDRSCAPGVQTN